MPLNTIGAIILSMAAIYHDRPIYAAMGLFNAVVCAGLTYVNWFVYKIEPK